MLKSFRKHARGRMGVIHYRYSHIHVTLEEGEPPKDENYYYRELSPDEKLQQWIEDLRNRRVNDNPLEKGKYPGRYIKTFEE